MKVTLPGKFQAESQSGCSPGGGEGEAFRRHFLCAIDEWRQAAGPGAHAGAGKSEGVLGLAACSEAQQASGVERYSE